MGRITIFTVTNCPHCRRVKAALKSRGDIPYTEINLSLYPSARVHMLQLADRLTVPQVFFNERHVGGADETMALLDTEPKWKDPTTAREAYDRDIASQPDPTDVRLQLPTVSPVQIDATAQPREACILLPDATLQTVLEVTQTLVGILPRDQTIQRRGTRYKRCFTGRQAVAAFRTHFSHANVDDAAIVQFGQQLVSQQMIRQCRGEKDEKDVFVDSPTAIYRLQCHDTPAILNSFRMWTEPRSDFFDPLVLIRSLQSMLSSLVQKSTDATTGLVNYLNAAQCPDCIILDEAVCELQAVDLFAMDNSTRTALCINVYNFMVEFAFIKVGIGTTSATRGLFFRSVAILMSGQTFSLNDLEHGILRGNRPPPYTFSPPFGPADPRLALAVPILDCRIHFALNCGARSCPPVQNFTAQALDEELRIVALSFCEQDDNVRLETAHSSTLFLSTILYWYQGDFAQSRGGLPVAILPFLRGTKRQLLEDAIQDITTIHVKFLKYDWGTKASEFACFDRSAVESNETSLWRFVLPW